MAISFSFINSKPFQGHLKRNRGCNLNDELNVCSQIAIEWSEIEISDKEASYADLTLERLVSFFLQCMAQCALVNYGK